MRRIPATLAAALLAAVALAGLTEGEGPAQAQEICTGDTSAAGVPVRPGPRVRFGITPAGTAGALGTPVPVTPGTRAETLRALARLRAPRRPFVLRLNRFFWSLRQAGFRKYLRRATGYTNRGYLVELQLRYHPDARQEGRIDRWLAFVRNVVRKFGRNPRVVGLQVANEVNFYPIAPDASDSAYEGARRALVRGVIAAHRLSRRLGYQQLEIGFNWAYRTDPGRERSFWEELATGGRPFRRAVDWVGLDAYPGTVFPPTEPPGGEADGIVAAMSQLRRCFMPIAGLGAKVPIHVEENGWPTGPGRPEERQEDALRGMVGAVHRFRGTYNVTDYRWFDLRDHNTSSGNFQQHYGLLRDDYSAKPAFAAYRELIRRFARRHGG
ncbi:MAG TPA: hypothetical protein VKA89_06300 [Solirubrobacterales bacterium]|nr:hypothetical protein [Solirubrobacterales bacterium]